MATTVQVLTSRTTDTGAPSGAINTATGSRGVHGAEWVGLELKCASGTADIKIHLINSSGLNEWIQHDDFGDDGVLAMTSGQTKYRLVYLGGVVEGIAVEVDNISGATIDAYATVPQASM